MALPQGFKQEAGNGRYTMGHLKTMKKVKIRVLSDFISGKCVWGEPDGKRVCTRRRAEESMPVGAIGYSEVYKRTEPIRQFIAAVVYNYTTDQVEVFETDKATIIGQIVEIESNEDWGDCKGYDISISKGGEGMETKYSVLPSPGKFDKQVEWKNIHVEVLFDGGDPFKATDEAEAQQITSTTKPQVTSEEASLSATDDEIPF